jgi:hypothetical protein
LVAAARGKPGAQLRIVLATDEGRVRPRRGICHACDGYVARGESACPHCGADLAAATAAYEQERRLAAIDASDVRSTGFCRPSRRPRGRTFVAAARRQNLIYRVHAIGKIYV